MNYVTWHKFEYSTIAHVEVLLLLVRWHLVKYTYIYIHIFLSFLAKINLFENERNDHTRTHSLLNSSITVRQQLRTIVRQITVHL